MRLLSRKREMRLRPSAPLGNLQNWISSLYATALLCLVCALPAHSQTVVVNAEEPPPTDAINLSAYEGLLKQYSEKIQEAKDDPAEIARIGKSLPKSWNVQAGKVNVSVSTDDLRHACEEGERVGDGRKEAPASAGHRLQMMLQAAEDLEQETKNAQDEKAQQELNKVFARSEFSKLNGPSFLDQWN